MLQRLRLLTILIAGCLLAGCQGTSTTPTPSPDPTYRCTPEAGGDEFECSDLQHQEMLAKDELYAEAEAVYRRYVAEDLRILRMGGVNEPTKELLATTTGDFLKQAMNEYRDNRRNKVVARGGARKVIRVGRLPGESIGGSSVAIATCADASSVKIFKDGKYLYAGQNLDEYIYLNQTDQGLKIGAAAGKKVKSCK